MSKSLCALDIVINRIIIHFYKWMQIGAVDHPLINMHFKEISRENMETRTQL